MATQEMIDWLETPSWMRPHKFNLTSDEACEAIAARLKALETMRTRVETLAQVGLDWADSGSLDTTELSAILDTVREGEK